MIKQLIASTLIATSIGIQNTTYNDIQSKNEFRYVSNIQDNYIYDQDEGTLDQHTQVKTIDYTTALFGSNFSIEARGITYINEDKGYDIYNYDQVILLKVNNTANLNLTRILYQISPTISNIDKTPLDAPDYVKLYYLTSLNTTETNFIEGANYNTYNDLYSVYTSITTNMTYIGDWQLTNNIYNIQSDHMYVVIKINVDYIDNLIGYNGAFMFTMNPPIMTINEEMTYEIPEIAGYEVVDIPGMMFTILGMPFAWISTAFNFTIFAGTIYEINISLILQAIVIGLIGLYIAKKIIK